MVVTAKIKLHRYELTGKQLNEAICLIKQFFNIIKTSLDTSSGWWTFTVITKTNFSLNEFYEFIFIPLFMACQNISTTNIKIENIKEIKEKKL